jgi:hypothetical membrane protein
MRLTDCLGIIGVIVVVLSTAAAIASYPGYDITGQFLSELGISAPSAYLFNNGLVAGGILMAAFFAGIRNRKSAAYGVVCSVLLAGIGAVPLVFHTEHLVVAGLFFLLAGAGMVAYGAAGRSRSPLWLTMLSVAAGAASLAYLAVHESPLVQKPAAILIMLWALVFFFMNSRKAGIGKKKNE